MKSSQIPSIWATLLTFDLPRCSYWLYLQRHSQEFSFLHQQVDDGAVNCKEKHFWTWHSSSSLWKQISAHWGSPQTLREQPPGLWLQWEKGHYVKYMALHTSRYEIRDLKHFEGEKSHKPFEEEQETQHTYYTSNLKYAMKWAQWGTFQVAGSDWSRAVSKVHRVDNADLLFDLNCVLGTKKPSSI